MPLGDALSGSTGLTAGDAAFAGIYSDGGASGEPPAFHPGDVQHTVTERLSMRGTGVQLFLIELTYVGYDLCPAWLTDPSPLSMPAANCQPFPPPQNHFRIRYRVPSWYSFYIPWRNGLYVDTQLARMDSILWLTHAQPIFGQWAHRLEVAIAGG